MHYASLTCDPRSLSTLYREQTVIFNHWVKVTTWTPWGQKGLLQPTFGATLALAIRTIVEYAIFAHSAPC